MKRVSLICIGIVLLIGALVLAGCSSGSTTSSTSPSTSSSAPPITTTKFAVTVTTSSSPATSVAPVSTTPGTTGGGELANVLGKVSSFTSAKYDSVISGAGIPSSTQKVYFKKTKIRVESSILGINTIIFVDTEKQTMYSYNSVQNTATKLNFNQAPRSVQDSVNTIMSYNPSVLGTETVDGKSCLVIQYNAPEGMVKEWLWKDRGFPVKIESTTSTGTVTILNQNIDFSDIPDSTFDLPAGVKIIDAGSLPTGIPTNFPTNLPTGMPSLPPGFTIPTALPR